MANTPKTIVDVVGAVKDYITNALSGKWDKSSQKVAGAYNLLENEAVSTAMSPATFTVNTDKIISVTMSEASTALIDYPVLTRKTMPAGLVPGKQYCLTGCTGGYQGTGGYCLYITFYDSSETNLGDIVCTDGGTVFTVPATAVKYRCGIGIFAQCPALSGKVFKPMITPDLTATYDDYVPHAKTNKELTDDSANKTDLTSIIATGSTNQTGATIAAGKYFYLNGTLCVAMTGIGSGATFTLDTNYKVANVFSYGLPYIVKVYTASGTTFKIKFEFLRTAAMFLIYGVAYNGTIPFMSVAYVDGAPSHTAVYNFGTGTLQVSEENGVLIFTSSSTYAHFEVISAVPIEAV